MPYTQVHRGKEVTYLEKHEMVVLTSVTCPKCGGNLSLMPFDGKFTLKCRCQMFFVYPESYLEGRGSVITLEQHKEKMKQDGLQERM